MARPAKKPAASFRCLVSLGNGAAFDYGKSADYLFFAPADFPYRGPLLEWPLVRLNFAAVQRLGAGGGISHFLPRDRVEGHFEPKNASHNSLGGAFFVRVGRNPFKTSKKTAQKFSAQVNLIQDLAWFSVGIGFAVRFSWPLFIKN